MSITLVGLKEERTLELWAEADGAWKLVHDYPIQAASGARGPKLREGDRQVPEGVYRIVGLNPNSSYHLSLELDYPNRFDRLHAERDGRDEPGSDIFIHGKAVSVGCLAMGDRVIEELFVLTEKIDKTNARVLIAPHDGRQRSFFPVPSDLPEWAAELYRSLDVELRKLGEADDELRSSHASAG